MGKNKDFLVAFLLYKDELDLFVNEFCTEGFHICCIRISSSKIRKAPPFY